MAEDLKGTALLFDLDGTLVDTVEDLAAAMNHALSEVGLAAVPTAEVRHLVGHGARRMLMRGYMVSAGREAGAAELDLAMTRFLDHYQANIAVHSRPFDHAIEMIEGFLARGARAAICTNKREQMARLLIETLGVSPLFDAIVGADTTVAAKPDPAPVRFCLEKTGARRAVFIGDSDTDIRAAKAADLPCFVADFGYGPITLAAEAAGRFSHYREACRLIEIALRT